MRIATVKNDDGSFEIYFNKLGGWDDYYLIENILVKDNHCSIIKENDMITDKDVILKSDDMQFLLRHHYMLGNYIYTKNSSDVSMLEQLANDVIDIIKIRLTNMQQ